MNEFFYIFTYAINIGIIFVLAGLFAFICNKTKDKEVWYIGKSLTYLKLSLIVVIILDIIMTVMRINLQFISVFPIILILNGFLDMMALKVGKKAIVGMFTGCKFEDVREVILASYSIKKKDLFVRINLENGKYKIFRTKYNDKLIKDLKKAGLRVREA